MTNEGLMKKIFIDEFEAAFDDLDANRVVYYGNFVKFCDRVRNKIFEGYGFSFKKILDENITFSIIEMNSKYFKPIEMGKFWIVTKPLSKTLTTFTIRHEFYPLSLSKKEIEENNYSLVLHLECHFCMDIKLATVSLSERKILRVPIEIVRFFK